MNKKKIMMSIGCVLFITLILVISVLALWDKDKNLSEEEINEYLKEKSLPLQTLRASYIVDMDNLKELVGLVDYVFVAEVLGIKEIVYGEREEDVKTVYNVRVLQNVKGEFEINNEVEIVKAGGVDKDEESIIYYEGDELPIVNERYIFFARVNKNGELLCSGKNTSIKFSEDKLDEAILSYENEIVYDRKRYKSKYEVE